MRCVGENYQGDKFAWTTRSCHFKFICYNMSSREFEVYSRPDDEALLSTAAKRPFLDVSGTALFPSLGNEGTTTADDAYINNHGISLGSAIVRHPKDKIEDWDDIKATFKWFPTVVRSSPPEQYYALDDNIIFVPFHSLLKKEGEGKRWRWRVNESHDPNYSSVFWDDLLPIYTLLNIFQLLNHGGDMRPTSTE